MGGVVGAVGEDFGVLLAGGVSLLVEAVGDGRVGEYLAVLLLLLLLLVMPLLKVPKVPEMGELGLF